MIDKGINNENIKYSNLGLVLKYISTGKILTRKSFSMGEAEEKRYYLECKQIKEI